LITAAAARKHRNQFLFLARRHANSPVGGRETISARRHPSAFGRTPPARWQPSQVIVLMCESHGGQKQKFLPITQDRLDRETQRHAQAAIAHSLESNSQVFSQEREHLDRWAEDMVLAAEKELADTKAQIKALNRQSRLATTVDEQHALQNKIRDLEKVQRTQRQQIFNVEDEIKGKRDLLIEKLEKRLSQNTSSEHLFSIRWQVV